SIRAPVRSSPSSTFRPYTSPRSTTLMPSSGSTTSRIASSRSARNSSSGAVVSLIPDLLQAFACLSQRVLASQPAEQRAFHPRRIFGHSGEGDAVAQYILVPLHGSARGDHVGKRVDGLQRLGHALTDHLLGEHRRRGLADRTALSVIGDVRDARTVFG